MLILHLPPSFHTEKLSFRDINFSTIYWLWLITHTDGKNNIGSKTQKKKRKCYNNDSLTHGYFSLYQQRKSPFFFLKRSDPRVKIVSHMAWSFNPSQTGGLQSIVPRMNFNSWSKAKQSEKLCFNSWICDDCIT